MPKVPFCTSWTGNVLARRATHTAPNPPVQITTLSNGIRVATEATPGHFSSVGLYVDAGARYEVPSSSGVSHFIDRMAFKSTASRNGEQMAEAIHSLGGQIFCSSSRESIMYQSSSFAQSTSTALRLIAETVLRPAFTDDEVAEQREAARYEIREINSKPEMILPEILHQVAYGNHGLGNPLLCPDDRVDVLDGDAMRDFMEQWYRPERMVVAGAGMQHGELVEWADKYFAGLKPADAAMHIPEPLPVRQPLSRSAVQNSPLHPLPPASAPLSLYKSLSRAASSYLYPHSSQPVTTSAPMAMPPTQYTGGHCFVHRPELEFNHLYLAFEGVGIYDNDVYALATIQILLGGGGSFSAGGPGKGMYSRLYTHILNHHPQIDHCASFHHIYTDSSLFGLFASFLPSSPATAKSSQYYGSTPSQVLPHLTHQLSLLLYQDVPHVELNRAKNQLKSSLMMALESRAVEVEDLGRQILVHNRKVPVTEMCDRIDEVTEVDIRRVAARVFGPGSRDAPGAKATIVTMGSEDVVDWKSTLQKYGVGE
ncbi:mitochondrial processing peptidase [Hysterangium stoloniferum]|nr:mitochondrial processing peptidase [Hysterangium stoloniferum]